MSDRNVEDQDDSEIVQSLDQNNSNLTEQPIEQILESDSLDKETKLKLLRIAIIKRETTAFSGPIPHPEILRGYEEILPGSADRILSMTEKEGDHRRQIEKKIVTTDGIRSYLGLGAGFIIAIVGLGGSIYLGINGKNLASGILSVGTLTGLVTVFVTGDKRRKEDVEENEE